MASWSAIGDTIIFYSDAFVSVPGMQSELYRLNVLTGAVHPLNLGRRLCSVCLRAVRTRARVPVCARLRSHTVTALPYTLSVRQAKPRPDRRGTPKTQTLPRLAPGRFLMLCALRIRSDRIGCRRRRQLCVRPNRRRSSRAACAAWAVLPIPSILPSGRQVGNVWRTGHDRCTKVLRRSHHQALPRGPARAAVAT